MICDNEMFRVPSRCTTHSLHAAGDIFSKINLTFVSSLLRIKGYLLSASEVFVPANRILRPVTRTPAYP